MKRLSLFLCLLAAILIIPACQEDVQEPEQNDVPEEVLSQLHEMFFDTEGVERVENGYLVEGDIIMTDEALAHMYERFQNRTVSDEQFHTYNLVTTPRVITVSGSGLPTIISQGLDLAIENFNNENLTLTMTRVSSGGDINVNWDPSGNGGVAGFPTAAGDPFGSVTIFGLTTFPLDVVEHVVTHELGHCVGFRHTNWFRRNCSGPKKERENPEGAVPIPGTPTGTKGNSTIDWDSIMIACFSGNEDGEFSNFDKIALDYLY